MRRFVLSLLFVLLGTALSFCATDQYGGNTALPCGAHTHNWDLLVIQSHWYFCDPDDNAWWGSGMSLTADGWPGNTDYTGATYSQYFIQRYGDDGPKRGDAQNRQLQGWNFNLDVTYGDIYSRPWYFDTVNFGPSGFSSHPMPGIINVRPAFYSVVNNGNAFPCTNTSTASTSDSSTCTLPINIVQSYSPYAQAQETAQEADIRAWTGNFRRADLYDPRLYNVFLPNYFATTSTFPALDAHPERMPWLVAIGLDDSDQVRSKGSPQYGISSPSSSAIDGSWGMLDLTGSPVLYADNIVSNTIHFDGQVRTRAHMMGALQAEYSTVSALNAAWNSTYTTLSSSGTQVTGESVGSSDGATDTFNHTLANLTPSQLSLAVKVNGTLVAGGVPGPSNAFCSTSCSIWGPNVSGSYDSTSGVMSVTFAATAHALGWVQGDGAGRVTFYCEAGSGAQSVSPDCGTAVGEIVTLSATHYSGACTITSQVEILGVCTLPGNVATTKDTSGTMTPPTHMTAGLPVTVDYCQNCWGIGTGLKDEDGRPSHSWVGNQYADYRGQSTAMQADEDQQIYDLWVYYLDNGCGQVKTKYPGVLCFGPDSLFTNGVIGRRPVMQAVKQSRTDGQIDFVESAGFDLSDTLNQQMLADAETYMGDIPMFVVLFYTAQLDSYFSRAISSSSCVSNSLTVNVASTVLSTNSGLRNIGGDPVGAPTTNKSVVTTGLSEPSYNFHLSNGAGVVATANSPTSVTFPVASCLPTTGGFVANSHSSFKDYPTQQARGQAIYHKIVQYLFKTRYPVSGHFPIVGSEYWDYQDNNQESIDWGLVTVKGNAYDGAEDVAATGVNCPSTGLVGKCGGEDHDMGNAITCTGCVKDAMALWQSFLKSSNVAASSGRGIAF